MYFYTQFMGFFDEMSQVIEVFAFISMPFTHFRSKLRIEQYFSGDGTYIDNGMGET
jgi:hypothetical protein